MPATKRQMKTTNLKNSEWTFLPDDLLNFSNRSKINSQH